MAKSQNNDRVYRNIPVKVVSEFNVSADELRHRRIAEKAHEIYECRGYCHGRDLDDWLEAERLILSEVVPAESGNAQMPRPRGPRVKKR